MAWIIDSKLFSDRPTKNCLFWQQKIGQQNCPSDGFWLSFFHLLSAFESQYTVGKTILYQPTIWSSISVSFLRLKLEDFKSALQTNKRSRSNIFFINSRFSTLYQRPTVSFRVFKLFTFVPLCKNWVLLPRNKWVRVGEIASSWIWMAN